MRCEPRKAKHAARGYGPAHKGTAEFFTRVAAGPAEGASILIELTQTLRPIIEVHPVRLGICEHTE